MMRKEHPFPLKLTSDKRSSSGVMHPDLNSGRSECDDGRWEWDDTPRRDDYRDSRPSSSRSHHNSNPSPSPLLAAASPDARFVSPWHGGHTPHASPRKSPGQVTGSLGIMCAS